MGNIYAVPVRGALPVRYALVAIALLLFVSARPALAQDKLLTIDDIYDPVKRVNFDGTPTFGLTWLKEGTHYLQGRGDRAAGTFQLMRVNATSGEAAPFYDAAKMERALAALPGFSAADAKRLSHLGGYQMNEAQTAVLLNHANDLFYYAFGTDKAVRLTNSPAEEVGEEFSPDGKIVSFIRNNNLYLVEISTQRERALTDGGNAKLLNGRLDWVYQEEVYGRGNFKGYWWSPDSTRLVYLQIDESPVNEFTVVDHIPHLQELEVTPYPKAGDPNPKVKLGVVDAVGGDTRWMDTTKYQTSDFLIVRVGWTPDSRKVAFQVQDREQTWLDLNFATPADGKVQNVMRETSKAWLEPTDAPYWLADGSFLWLAERNGWRHIYHYSTDGKLIKQVTDGEWDLRSIAGVDAARGLVYFTSSEHSPIADHLYRIKLDGTGMTRLSNTEGSHNASFNPTKTLYIDFWSDINTPTQVRLYQSDGKLARTIEENRVDTLRQYKLGKPEFVHVKTRDGFTMEAMMIKPPDFDPQKKYPVMSYTYSGPQAPSVRDRWGGATYMWHQLLAQKGYIIWICDNRTASSKGVGSAYPVYGNFGELELRDLEDGVAWLKTQPYVDGSRIGIWGWSYGGFMTAYAMTHSQSFRLGIAGAPVTDWRLYDSIYTERYMKTPQKNPQGYDRSSAIKAAKDLHGKLLIIHGTVDDNVHMQNSIQFAYELQRAGKQFEMMTYAKQRHGFRDPLIIKHMRTLMTDFITQNL